MSFSILSFVLVLARAADAAPPSSTLTGSSGTLSWSVQESGATVQIQGRSPRWSVVHEARADLSPVRTERTGAAGERHTIVYDAQGATVTGPDGTERFDVAGLWDADTVDVRLGQAVAQGRSSVRFEAIDVTAPKVYTFEAKVTEQTTCGSQPCTAVELTLTGVLKLLGPTWRYWYAQDGGLLRFEGPIGDYSAAGVGGAR